MATTTDIDFGLVHSKTGAEALTDSQTHQGKIYFPSDDMSIIKNGRRFGLSKREYYRMEACTYGLDYQVTNYSSEANMTTVPLSIRKGDKIYVELVTGTKDPDSSDDYECIGIEDLDTSASENFDQWIESDLDSSNLKISTFTTGMAIIRIFIKNKPFTK